jgi:hypothetical protein
MHSFQQQEELHAIGANAILANAHRETIKPCRYTFPVTTFADAVGLAATFTDLVLSVLPTVQTSFAEDGGQEIGLINLVSARPFLQLSVSDASLFSRLDWLHHCPRR